MSMSILRSESRRGASFPSPCTQHIRSHKQTRCRPLSIALPGWPCHVPGREFGAAAVGQSILVFYF